MYVQLKTGYPLDQGPAWITRVRFSKTWRTAYVHGLTLARTTALAYANHDSNFYDVTSGEEFWISGPKRDRSDGRYSSQQLEVEPDVRADYDAFLAGAPLPGRERG